jgi:hypothetical protein
VQTFDYRTPERKAYLRLLLEHDGDSGGTQFDEWDEDPPCINLPGENRDGATLVIRETLTILL